MKLTLTEDPTIALDKDGNKWYLTVMWINEEPIIKWERATEVKCTCSSFSRCGYCITKDLIESKLEAES
jgi:hypothetical protein